MEKWTVLFHNPLVRQSLITMIEAMNVEVLSPCFDRSRKRPDRPSCITKKVPLFPGYLLLRFDPEVIHTTAITALSGAYSFVRFGDQPCIVQNEVIEKLNDALVRSDRSLDCIDYRNLPTDLEKSLHTIISMPTVISRQAAFLSLLQQGAALERLVSQARVRSYTSVDPL